MAWEISKTKACQILFLKRRNHNPRSYRRRVRARCRRWTSVLATQKTACVCYTPWYASPLYEKPCDCSYMFFLVIVVLPSCNKIYKLYKIQIELLRARAGARVRGAAGGCRPAPRASHRTRRQRHVAAAGAREPPGEVPVSSVRVGHTHGVRHLQRARVELPGSGGRDVFD